MATWFDFCTKRPGPSWKQGYGGIITSRPLAIISGEVKHITLGPLSAALGVLDGPKQVSWPFTIPKTGRPLQHYPLESINWHAGLMGDADPNTELAGNIGLVGEEHEAVDGDTPTDSQFHWTTEISRETRRLCPLVAANPPELAVNLWEHNWLVATSCPNKLWSHTRNNWDWLIAALGEDDMPVFFRNSKGTIAIATAQGKRRMGGTEWGAWVKAGATYTQITDAQYNAIPNYQDTDGGLARGIVLAIGTGKMNSAMRRGDTTGWKPPTDLLDVIAAIQPKTSAAIVANSGKIRQWCREAIVSANIEIPKVHKAILTAIAAIQSGSGLSFDKTVEAVKKAGRDGTGNG